MDRDSLVQLYDERYAAAYNETFLDSDLGRSDAAHESRIIRRLLKPGMRWLDVACGTGYFLSRFPEFQRAGLDLSPAMLALARRANPGVPLYEGSYLDEHPEWREHWDLVSCMWYAYGLVSSMRDLQTLVANLASWTSPGGHCFVPLADPRLIAGVDLPYAVTAPWPGQLKVTGILWTHVQEDKVHEHLFAPQVEYMEELFGQYFERIELEVYPPALPGWKDRRRALVASRKK